MEHQGDGVKIDNSERIAELETQVRELEFKEKRACLLNQSRALLSDIEDVRTFLNTCNAIIDVAWKAKKERTRNGQPSR